MNLNVSAVCDDESFAALAGEWDTLVARAGIDHPFLSYDWVRTWWQCFGAGRELYVVTVRRDETLIAVAPLMRSRVRMYGLSVWRLEFIANVHTPRFDFIIDEHAEDAYELILEHLRRDAPGWQVLMLPELSEGSPTVAALEGLAALGSLRTTLWSAGASPRISIRGSFASYWASLPTKRRSTLRSRLQRLEQQGPVSLEVVAHTAELPAALRDGLRIEAAGWKGAAGTAIARNDDLRRFYEQIAQLAARSGLLQLVFLTVAGKRIAFGYCLRHARTLYVLKTGYDPEYASFSPFNVLLLLVIEAGFRDGLAAVDLLGCAEPWKRAWTDQQVERRWLFLFPNTVRALAVYGIKAMVLPGLRSLRGRLAHTLHQFAALAGHSKLRGAPR